MDSTYAVRQHYARAWSGYKTPRTGKEGISPDMDDNSTLTFTADGGVRVFRVKSRPVGY